MNDSAQKSLHEEAALLFDPFDGDFGDGEVRVVNEIITAPELPRCHHCGGRIKQGSRIRRLVERRGRTTTEYLFCTYCCKAMAACGSDRDPNGNRWEKRTNKYRRENTP